MALDAALLRLMARMDGIERLTDRLIGNETPWAIRQASIVLPSGTITGSTGVYQTPSNGSITFTTVTGSGVLLFYSGAPTVSGSSAGAQFAVSGATTNGTNNLTQSITTTGVQIAFGYLMGTAALPLTAGANTFSVQFSPVTGQTLSINNGSVISVFVAVELVPRF